MREKVPGLTGRTVRTSTLRALGKCRAYTDSLHNEQFCLPHLLILQISSIKTSLYRVLFPQSQGRNQLGTEGAGLPLVKIWPSVKCGVDLLAR